jgi:hypothetical protein
MPNMTEREFLDQQSEQARQAMARTAKLLGKNLGRSVDPRTWAKSHPWLSLSAAVVAGFAAVSIIPHRKKPPAPPVEGAKGVESVKADENGESAGHGLFHSLLAHGFKTGWRMLASVVISKIVTRMKQDEAEEPPAATATPDVAPQPAEHVAE